MPEPITIKNDFISIFTDLRNGRAHIDVSRQLSELIEAVVELKKKGTLTLQLTITPSAVHESGRLADTQLSWTCKIKKPEATTGGTTFFVTEDGKLSRVDPDQGALWAGPTAAVNEQQEDTEVRQ